MTYVVPNSKLYILKGIPITNNYKNTLYFANITAQYNYFYGQSTPGLRFTDYSYIRVNNNKVKVQIGADSVYDANYMMFQNTNFGSKWFYAFITNVEYINNETTEITFEIDRIQTWWFDVNLKACMVERQHAVNDGIYVNCEPENFAISADYTHYDTNLLNDAGTASIYVTITTGHFTNDDYSLAWVPATPKVIDGVYCTLEILPWRNNPTSINSLKNYLNAIILGGHEEDLISVFVAPKVIGDFLTDTPAHGTRTFAKSTLRANAFQGYVPRNNKIYNYPFFKLLLEKGGTSQEYAIEDFRTGTTDVQATDVVFEYYAIANPAPQVIVVPKNYRGMATDYNSGLENSDFPQCPIKGDTYSMWIVQNSQGYLANGIGALVNLALSAGRLDAVGTFIDLRQMVQQGFNFIGQSANYENKADNVSGLGKPAILSNIGENTFWLHAKSLNYWEARQIDTYFDMYGYAENHVFVPNIHARQRWTYVKTAGCVITGNAPAEEIAFIENCFDKGITWWVNAGDVGNYSLSNPTL